MVCDPRELVILVSTGVLSLTLVQTSVTVGCGGLAGGGAFGNCGAAGAFGSEATFGICGSGGSFGSGGAGGFCAAGSTYRLPSTSWPSIMLLPKSCTCIGGEAGAAALGIFALPDGAAPGGGGIGMIIASFFK